MFGLRVARLDRIPPNGVSKSFNGCADCDSEGALKIHSRGRVWNILAQTQTTERSYTGGATLTAPDEKFEVLGSPFDVSKHPTS
jgi:hypothetical protein